MEQARWDQVERYLEHLERDLSASPNTVAAYRNDLTQLYQHLLLVPARAADSIRLDDSDPEVHGWETMTIPTRKFMVGRPSAGLAWLGSSSR